MSDDFYFSSLWLNFVNYLGYYFRYKRTTVHIPLCPRCSLDDGMKKGVARTVNGVLKQKYECNKCGRKFQLTKFLGANSIQT